MDEKRRVLITGVGPLSSLGIGKEKSWDNILNQKTGLKLEKIYIDEENWENFYIHKISDFNILEFGFDQNLLDEIKTWKNGAEVMDLNYFLATIKLALDDSKLVYNKKDKIGLVLAHENAGMNQFFLEMFNEAYNLLIDKRIKKKEFITELYNFGAKKAYDLQTFMFIYHVCKIFKIHNFSLFINNACASGLYAIEVAADIIKSGKCDIVVVAAVDHPDVYKYLWFKNINMYSPDGKIKPFSRDANGFVFGEGGAALILEDSMHAMKRSAKIYAEYLRGDFCLEGWKIAYPAIKESFYTNLLKNVIYKSGLKLSDIDLINPHGVGNRIIDSYEAKAITDVFGSNLSTPLITALKPYIGHVLGGSAFLETAILLIAFEKNVIPPTLNCESLDRALNIKLLTKKKTQTLNSVLKICSAFAGFDAAIILKRFNER